MSVTCSPLSIATADAKRAGPFLFAPISELYGRQVAYLISQFCYFVFCIGTAVCQK